MSLHLHRAERTDVLADGLAGLLATPLADPFAEEVVVVPAKGVERWLSQRLSHRLGAAPGAGDGVCAGVRFTSPRSLVAAVLGLTDDDPWAADAMAWPLLAVLDDSLDEAWCAPVARHLGHFDTGAEAELRRGRRYAVSARLARLFAAYAVQRPTLLADWLDGRATDGRGGDLDDDLAWQPELWRRLVDRVGAPPPHRRHADTLVRLRDEPEAFDLPERLSLFGHTRLPVTEVELLDALAARRAVHLWLPHPSGALWDALAPALSGAAGGAVDRAGDDSHHAAGHPLLATLARDSRELQRALAGVPADDEHTPMPTSPDTLLGWLQDDLRGNTLSPAGRRRAADDRSVQVHACHGAARQVDVLREVLLGMLESDPTLEPRDILVMCPDIETYAPLITAGFGLGDLIEGGHPAHRLRVRLADRSLAQTNPLLGVAAQLLDIAGSRATSSQVLDLAQAEPVRRRFGFTDDDLDTITTWVRESGVRWAFDREHREAFGLAGYQQNTWRAGLDRVLSGVVMSADAQAWLDTTLPLDDVGSTRIELAGRFAEYVDRVRSVTDRLDGSRPLADWLGALGDGIDVLTRVGRDDGWQVGQVQRELAGVAADADTLADTALRLPDVRALLASHLAGRPTRANFRTGTLTVCTMVPMRSVPHRVVCLLGLDDGVFPRFGLADGDDVLARRPVTGERDVRSEDRQLLCDAILAATESLVVTYTGANEHTGQRRPPAVPLGELLDALDRTTDAPARAAIERVHPLQPFDSMNLEPGRLGTPGPFTFDPTALVAARAAAGRRPAQPRFLAGPLALPAGEDVGLADLLAFFRDPVKGFFRSLDVTLPWDVDGISDVMPVEIDNLEKWSVGDRMLRDMLSGIHPDEALQMEWRRGVLPPGRLGWRTGTEIREQAMQLAIRALTHRQVAPEAVDVDVDLGGGRRLTGTVPSVYARRLVSVGYSRLDAKQLLTAWIQLLALSANDDDHNWTALVIGRPPRGSNPAARLFAPVGADARPLLADLVDVYDLGRQEPLPLPLKTSFAWAQARQTGDNPVAAAESKWLSKRWEGENADPAHERVWGAHASLEALMEPPRPGEDRPGEHTRLGAYAARVWEPMLRFEQGGAVMEPFDLLGELPSGTTVLEASAGTGKTYALAGLVTRYVAEGAATLDEMLLITFGRAASQELRERVRDQLTQAEGALADPEKWRGDDGLLGHLVRLEEHEAAHARLRDALAGFDAATIATTHQFCQLVLRSLGVAGDTDAGVTLVDDLGELVAEVVDDLYLLRFGGSAEAPPFTRATALEIATKVVGNPHTSLVPQEYAAGSAEGARVDFALAVLAEVERRKRRLGILGYDDLLTRLAAALEDPAAPARQRMRRRWSVVMVDEFQDTDPVQWKVIDAAFNGHSTLVLIGDPKQAIYAFRGGDIATYLQAADTAGERRTLGTNWRSDQPLVDTLQVVLGGAQLGHEDIVVREVAAHHQGSRLSGAPSDAPFRLRVARREAFGVAARKTITIDALRDHIARDLAADIGRLLASGATYDRQPVRAGDVAVIVEAHKDARACREALAEAGIPAVYSGDLDIFSSQAARDWLCLLEAFEQPHRSGLVRAAATTMFFGETAASLHAGGDALTDRIGWTLRAWADHLRARGVAAVFEAAQVAGMAERVLAWRGGEREMTDLAHLAQLLHETAHRERFGLPALLDWLREETTGAGRAAERTRRLDSDAAAVQIMTVWVSKGLQYPLVYLPFGFNRHVFDDELLLFHEDGARCLDIGGKRRSGHSTNQKKWRAEVAGDDIRLTYVALTRAQSQVVAWWAPSWDEGNGGISRLLRGRKQHDAAVPDSLDKAPSDDEVLTWFRRWQQAGGPVVEESVVAELVEPVPEELPSGLAVRSFTREVDIAWRRTSYSGLTRAADQQPGGVASEPEDAGLEDESVEPVPTTPEAPPPPDALPSPMEGLPAGATFGSLVHAVLEEADPHAPDLAAELSDKAREQLGFWPVDVTPDVLAEAMLPLHTTPLGPLVPGLTLGDIALGDRLRELDFEIPLAGGDHAVAADVRLAEVAPLLRKHLPADDPLRAYADRLEQPLLGGQSLRGYLSGSIDVVLRAPGDRFVVVDYKTNRLGDPERPATSADYGPDQLAAAMLHSDYPLQALLYSVVVHRYLRWRLPAYDPATHLGGVVYLYLRGMCGPETPLTDGHPAGVFSWPVPPELVLALSEFLDGQSLGRRAS